MLDQWIMEQLTSLMGEQLIILGDPQRMIRAAAQADDGYPIESNFTVLFSQPHGQRRRRIGGSIMNRTLHGKIHGRTIELDEDPGVAEGQEVEVQMKVVEPPRKWGDGILRTAGALADDPDWDAIMDEVHNARKIERRPQGEFE